MKAREDLIAPAFMMHRTRKPRRAVIGLEKRDRAGFAPASEPALDHPRGMRMKDSEPVGRRMIWREEFVGWKLRFIGGAAQDRIRERRSGGLPSAFHQFDRLMNGCASRHALQKAKLVDAHAEGDRDWRIEAIEALLGMAFEQKIEQAAPAQDAERQFGGERRIGGGDFGFEFGVEQIARIGARGFHAKQDLERDSPRWADGHRVPSEHTRTATGKN